MTITVHGTPAPQGSKTKSKWGAIIDDNAKSLKPWREAVKWAALEAPGRSFVEQGATVFHGPVTVEVDFYFVHPKTGKRRGSHSVKPDIDKLLRSTFDALTDAGVFEDDSRICSVQARKHYATQYSPVPAGAVIRVERWIA